MAEWEDDERLAARYAAEGDARALETLFRRHVEATYAFARRFLRRPRGRRGGRVGDLAAGGARLRAGGFRGESRFKTWLLGIARLVCLERLRQPRLPTLSLSGLTETDRGDWLPFSPGRTPCRTWTRPSRSPSVDHRLVLPGATWRGLRRPSRRRH